MMGNEPTKYTRLYIDLDGPQPTTLGPNGKTGNFLSLECVIAGRSGSGQRVFWPTVLRGATKEELHASAREYADRWIYKPGPSQSDLRCEYNGCSNVATKKAAIGGENTPPPVVTRFCDKCLASMWAEVCEKGLADRANLSICPVGQRHPWETKESGQ